MRYSLKEVLALLDFSEALIESLSKLESSCRKMVDETLIRSLTDQASWYQAQAELERQITKDSHGLRMLCCMMMGASYTLQAYQESGIPMEVFVDTMNAFPRFVREYKVMYHCEGFDRGFWTGRQLSLQLFRIEELEFELCIEDQQPVISIHIPSDASITKQQCISSIHQAKAFFQTYKSCDEAIPMICESWLLSPALKELLPHTSRIIQFQSLFDIQSWNQDAKDYLMWVYHCEDKSPMELSEDTSLQRSMKQYIIHGGAIGNAKGTLKILDKV